MHGNDDIWFQHRDHLGRLGSADEALPPDRGEEQVDRSQRFDLGLAGQAVEPAEMAGRNARIFKDKDDVAYWRCLSGFRTGYRNPGDKHTADLKFARALQDP